MFKKIAKILSITLLLATGVLLDTYAAGQQATPQNFSVVEFGQLPANKQAEIKPLSEVPTIESCVHYTLVYQKITPSTTSTTTNTTIEPLTTSTIMTSKEELTPVIATNTTTATPVQIKQQLPETGTQKTLSMIISAAILMILAIIAIKNHNKKIILFFAIGSGVLTLYNLHTTIAQAEMAPLSETTPLTITKQDDVKLLGFIAAKDENCSITTTPTTATEETTGTTTTTTEKAKVTTNYWFVDTADFEELKKNDLYKKVHQNLIPFFPGPPTAGTTPNANPVLQTYTYQKDGKEITIQQKTLSTDGKLRSRLDDEFVVKEVPTEKLKLKSTTYQEYKLNDSYETVTINIPGYKLATLKENSAPVSGTVDKKDGIVIDYVYTPFELPDPPHVAPQ